MFNFLWKSLTNHCFSLTIEWPQVSCNSNCCLWQPCQTISRTGIWMHTGNHTKSPFFSVYARICTLWFTQILVFFCVWYYVCCVVCMLCSSVCCVQCWTRCHCVRWPRQTDLSASLSINQQNHDSPCTALGPSLWGPGDDCLLSPLLLMAQFSCLEQMLVLVLYPFPTPNWMVLYN